MPDRLTDGNTRVSWVPTLSNKTAPTVAELTAGVALETFITGDGLDLGLDQNPVDTTALNSTSELNSFGRSKVDTTLTMKRGNPDTAWTTFAGQPLGFLVVRRGTSAGTAFATTQKVEVYPVASSKRFPQKPAANEVEKFQVKFGLTSDYVEEAVVA